jgi:hypothetical protein
MGALPFVEIEQGTVQATLLQGDTLPRHYCRGIPCIIIGVV